MRFHEGAAAPAPCYGRAALESRARLLHDMYGATTDIYVYFNNDARACAVRDAHGFALAAGRAGLTVTHTPAHVRAA
jgi:uncharacterized protein YecE (DUF72 family)